MRIKTFLAVCSSVAALCASATDYPCSWTAGATPATLAEGTLALTYDETETSRVKTIVANPGYGNRIIVSGDTMALAANPAFTVTEGTLRFDNALDGTGTLTCKSAAGTDTFTWEDAEHWLTGSWRTVFPGAQLDDHDVVAAQGRGPDGSYNPNPMTAYHMTRRMEEGVSYLDYQLQTGGIDTNGYGYIKALWVTLKQADDGISAKISRTAYIVAKAKGVSIVGKDVNELVANPDAYTIRPYNIATTPANIEKGYGMHRIVLKRVGNFPQVRLEGLVTNSTDGVLMPVSIAAGASVWAGNGSGIGRLPAGASISNAGELTFGNIALDINAPDPNAYHYGALSSSGKIRYVCEESETDCTKFYKEGFLTNWTTVGTGVSLYDITNFTGKLSGGYVGSNKDKPCQLYHYKISGNGLTATGQVQGVAGVLRCIVVAFRQNGYIVQMRGVQCYCGDTAEGSNTPGYDFIEAAANGLVGNGIKSANFVTTENGKGYAVHEFSVLYGKPDGSTLRGYYAPSTLAVANGSTVEVAGTDSRRMQVEFSRANSLPENGVLEVGNGGCAVLNPNTDADPEQNYFANGTCLIRVQAGGMLCQRGKWAIGAEQQIELLGGTLWCGYIPAATWEDSMTYANHVTFRDGALLRGLQVRLGFSSATTKWTVAGSSSSTCDTSVVAIGNKSNGHRTITWDVDDVTGDSGTDFNLNGALRRYTSDNSHTNFHLLKTGAGTMSLNAACPADAAIPGLTIIENGTWLLNASDAMRSESPVRLAGGTLAVAAETANTLGFLAIDEAGGGLSLGAGATLAFADSSEEAWTPTNKVTVIGFAENAIRFGESEQAVPRARGVFATEGYSPLFVNRMGYLTAVPPGSVFSLR